jgi:Tfp pilus assembly protein PilN
MKVKRARLQLWVVPLVLVLAGILYLVLYNSRASRNAPSYHEIEEFWLHSARPQQDGSGKTKIAANIAYQQGDKVAVVVVARPNNKVPSLMHNLAANLPAEWKLQIFHRYSLFSFSFSFFHFNAT